MYFSLQQELLDVHEAMSKEAVVAHIKIYWLTRQCSTCIQEVYSSNLGQHTDCPVRFSWFSSFALGEYWTASKLTKPASFPFLSSSAVVIILSYHLR
jgi:hypothetical protein